MLSEPAHWTGLIRGVTRRLMALVALGLLAGAAPAAAQIGQILAPGPLTKAHATLAGAANCQKCHTPGRKMTGDQCLSCHKPVAERMRQQKGIHRAVTFDCNGCHKEHTGPQADLRPFDLQKFDHARDTGFALEGRHAALVTACAKCHKTRSYLTLTPACASCHQDPHRPSFGANCQTCHPLTQTFKEAKKTFDHAKTTFSLVGAHQRVACEKCHVNKVYKGLKSALCTDCHKSPHRQIQGVDCRTCHTPETWTTQKVDHSKTAYPLKGRHADVPCAKCHVTSPVKTVLKFDRCAACHQDPHKGAFKQDCRGCHTETGFGKAPFDHAKNTKFALTEKHASLACAKCHKNVVTGAATPAKVVDYRGLSTTCVSCHADPHKAQLGQACETCHTPATFKLPGYSHRQASAFFGGQHQGVACASCHLAQSPEAPRQTAAKVDTWTFKRSMACATCHADIHLGQVGIACEACHAIDAAKFAAVGFAHTKAAYQLTGKHATVECRKCHKSETAAFPAGRGTAVRLKGLSTACASCHADQHAGQLGAKCETCHTPATFKLPTYKHGKAAAALIVGGHATLACDKCHKSQTGTFPAGTATTIKYKVGLACANCHTDQHRGALGGTCETCHTPVAWKTASRAFHKATAFKLEGQHLGVPCADCHWNGVIRGTPTKCFDCHWIRRQDDRYQTRLGNDCGSCHKPTAWTAVSWNHGTMTGLALSPAHKALGCAGCHKDGTFKAGSATCVGCHLAQYQSAATPNHVTAGFPTACDACHLPSHTAWSQARFSHASFALVGVHATQACTNCHKNNIYQGTSRLCIGCHKTDYDRTTNPNHAAAAFSTTCNPCHSVSSATWTASFNHTAIYPLSGLHATQTCSTCHKNNVYQGTPNTCVGCHKADYDRTVNPNHAAAAFSTTCASCHQASAASWSASFNHTAAYALVGVHATQACTTCHKNGVYKGTPNTCVGCHKADYDKATTPNHAAAGYSLTCDSCHTASAPSWTSAFNHNSVFQLVGVHATQVCSACHVNNVYHGTPRVCYGCHKTNYDRTTSPAHAAAGFPTTCDSCHNASSATWSATFNHSAYYPLVGVHATQACAACHVNGIYHGTSRDCYGCHKTNYDKTTTPNHAAAGFSTACDTCHNASAAAWTASFAHTSYPLVGVHATQPCTACHVNNIYAGTSRVCYGCHKTNYDRTTSPNHSAAGYPTTCDQCHSASSATWTASFAHTSYPLVGVHATQPCAACHVNNIYAGTTRLCYGCHKARYDATTSPNHAAAGFATTCDSCHSASAATWTASFNHSQYFVLAGRHLTAACTDCHKNNVYKGTPTTCYPCHQANYTATTNPNHIAAGFPTTCDTCHKFADASWTLAVFNHTWFPTSSGRHAGNACSACHTDPTNYKVFTCLTCHAKATTDSHHQGRTGYRYDSAACYSCHPRGSAG